MQAIAFYLLKLIICSGILYGYYLLALRNKVFHLWNRFYLLGAVLISLVLPAVTINIQRPSKAPVDNIVQLLNVVNGGEIFINEVAGQPTASISREQVIPGLYAGICVLLLIWTVSSIFRLRKLAKLYPVQKIKEIYFVNTDEKGTPFSFFKYIFWNRAIDPQSDTGTKIFKHELVHVKEWHSADRIFMNLVVCLFWLNPFFWLIRKEMYIVHEFIADSKSVAGHDRSSLAAMILQAAYPQHRFVVTSSFFTSTIKRRIMMLTKMENKKMSYATRILVLPVLGLIFTAFAVKIQEKENEKFIQPSPLTTNKILDVAVDKGRETTDAGMNTQNVLPEKEITTVSTKEQQATASDQPKSIMQKDNKEIKIVKDKKKNNFISYGNVTTPSSDTISTKIKSVDLTKDGQHVIVIYDNGSAEKISRQEAEKRQLLTSEESAVGDIVKGLPDDILITLDGIKISKEEMKTLDPSKISSISVFKDKDAIAIYGEKGKNGVLLIQTRKHSVKHLSEIVIVGYQRDGGPAGNNTAPQFQGGETAWNRFVSRELNKHFNKLEGEGNEGTCIVQFMVDANGSISGVEALTMQNTALAKLAIETIKKGPKWIPGTVEGKPVRSAHTQAITFKRDTK